jgi:hypothetical protein
MPYTIGEISDRLEIQDLYARYVHAVDDKDHPPLDAIFLPSTTFDWTASGGTRTTWAAAKEGDFLTGKLFPYVFHICTNLVIDFDAGGDAATVRSKTVHPTGLDGKEGRLMFQVQGVYVDRLVRTEGGWRISERVWRDFWAVGPLGVVDGIPGMLALAGKMPAA